MASHSFLLALVQAELLLPSCPLGVAWPVQANGSTPLQGACSDSLEWQEMACCAKVFQTLQEESLSCLQEEEELCPLPEDGALDLPIVPLPRQVQARQAFLPEGERWKISCDVPSVSQIVQPCCQVAPQEVSQGHGVAPQAAPIEDDSQTFAWSHCSSSSHGPASTTTPPMSSVFSFQSCWATVNFE